jgi:hypothetical protein
MMRSLSEATFSREPGVARGHLAGKSEPTAGGPASQITRIMLIMVIMIVTP